VKTRFQSLLSQIQLVRYNQKPSLATMRKNFSSKLAPPAAGAATAPRPGALKDVN
jgi:hypothetical protein